MGSLDPRPYALTLADLCAGAEAIALVEPDGEPLVEAHVLGEPPRPDRPTSPQVRYAWAWEPHRVRAWLRPPPEAPARIWIAAAGNQAAARDAQDEASGLFGHVHHVVPVPVLTDVPADVLRASGERIVFLRAVPPGRWQSVHEGIALAPEVRGRVDALVTPPPAPPRRAWWRRWW